MQVFSSKVLPFLSFFCLSFFRSYLGISFHLANLSACTSGVGVGDDVNDDGVVFVHSTLPQRFSQPHFFAQKIPPLLFLSLLSPFFLQSRSIRRQMHFFASFSAAAPIHLQGQDSNPYPCTSRLPVKLSGTLCSQINKNRFDLKLK